MHRDGIETGAGAGASFLTIGQSVEASLGGRGDHGRNVDNAPSAQCGLQVALSIFSEPGEPKAECYVIYGKCKLGGYQACCFIAYNTSCVAMKLDERQLQLPIMCLTHDSLDP